jgi:hypothetical protein
MKNSQIHRMSSWLAEIIFFHASFSTRLSFSVLLTLTRADHLSLFFLSFVPPPQVLVFMFARTHTDLLLPALEAALAADQWRIREAATRLLGDQLHRLAGAKSAINFDADEVDRMRALSLFLSLAISQFFAISLLFYLSFSSLALLLSF